MILKVYKPDSHEPKVLRGITDYKFVNGCLVASSPKVIFAINLNHIECFTIEEGDE